MRKFPSNTRRRKYRMKKRSATKTGKMRGAGCGASSARECTAEAPAIRMPAPLSAASLPADENDFSEVPSGAFERAAAEPNDEDAPLRGPDIRLTRFFNERFSDLSNRIRVLTDIYNLNNDKTRLLQIKAYYNQNRPSRGPSNSASTYASIKNELFERVLSDITILCFKSIDLFPNVSVMLKVKPSDIYVEELKKTDEILGSFIAYLDRIMLLSDRPGKSFNIYYNSFLERRKKLFDTVFRANRNASAPLEAMGQRRENMDLRKLLVILKVRHQRLRDELAEITAST
jgi:hypothetical protein